MCLYKGLRRTESPIRHQRKCCLTDLCTPPCGCRRGIHGIHTCISAIRQGNIDSAEAVLKLNQSRLSYVRSTHVKLEHALSLCLFNGLAEKEWHTAKLVKSLIRTAVLECHSCLVREREYAGDRLLIFESDSNCGAVTHRLEKIAKPTKWRGWHAVAAPSAQQEATEISQVRFGTAALANQTFSVSPVDLTPNAIAMHLVKETFKITTQRKPVKAERPSHCRFAVFNWAVFCEAIGRFRRKQIVSPRTRFAHA